MKKIFTALFLLMGLISFSQTTGYFRYDSTRLEKVGGNNELILLNSTRNVTGGVLTNLGNGRTGFVTPSGGSGGLSGGNLGLGFRLYYPPSQGVKTVFAGYGQLVDSTSNANGITLKSDTATLFPAVRATIPAGGGSTNHTLLSNLAWASSGHTGNATSIAAFDGAGAATYKQIGVDIQAYNAALAQIVGLSPSNDDILQRKSGAWTNRTIAQLKTDLNYTIPAQFNPIAGTNMAITGSYPNMTFNASGDNNWVYLSDYGTPNDGLQDTTALQNAVATGKNVYITPGIWEYTGKGFGVQLAKGQIVRGYGLSSIIHFTQDTINVFSLTNDSCFIDQVHFVGKGRGSTPGGEVFTFSNAVYISGNYNKVRNCYFQAVKGSGVTAWKTGVTIYGNDVSFNNYDSCGVGIYLLTNNEYGQYMGNKSQYCRVGFMERCAGNNMWMNITALYCDYGVRILGSSGCNGDHGQMIGLVANHNTVALDLQQVNNEYLIMGAKFYFGDVNFGSTDTVRRVIMDNCVFSGNTINILKASQSQVTGGTFGTSAVTVNAGSGVTFCNIQNSPYSAIICGGSPLSNPMTTAEDIIKGGSSGTPTRLAVGADGTYLGVSGGVLQYLTLPGGGDVTKVGTPVNNQIGVWTGNGTIEGDANLTWSGSALALTGTGSISTSLTTPKLIGGTGTTDDIIIQPTSGVGTTGSDIIFNNGNNGATNQLTINNAGEWGIGTAPASGFKLFIVTTGATGSTNAVLLRNSSSQNMLSIDNSGLTKIGNASQTSAFVGIFNRLNVGGATYVAPTALLHINAGTASANTAPLKFTSGTNLTSAEAGAVEYDGTNFYMSPSTTRKRIPLTNNATPSNGQIPIGNGTDYTVANITGSTGIAITNGSGTIDVNIATTTLTRGTWTPTIVGLSNVASSTAATGIYTRNGNIVSFVIYVSITPSAGTTNTSFTATLPIASDLINATDVIGTVSSQENTTYGSGFAIAATGSDLINIQFTSVTTTGGPVRVSGQYIVQ